ncbi:hypothetical protein RB213_001802 [Colletotrichum asianum]
MEALEIERANCGENEWIEPGRVTEFKLTVVPTGMPPPRRHWNRPLKLRWVLPPLYRKSGRGLPSTKIPLCMIRSAYF